MQRRKWLMELDIYARVRGQCGSDSESIIDVECRAQGRPDDLYAGFSYP